MAQLSVYRLVPTVGPDDPNFDLAQYHGEILVRARSSGDARVVAAEGEAIALGQNPALFTTETEASALLKPQLYSVRLIDDGRYPHDGPRQVLEADFRAAPRRSVAHTD